MWSSVSFRRMCYVTMNDKTKNKYIRSNFWIIAIKEIKIGVIYIYIYLDGIDMFT